jgi:hypothetical protein
MSGYFFVLIGTMYNFYNILSNKKIEGRACMASVNMAGTQKEMARKNFTPVFTLFL